MSWQNNEEPHHQMLFGIPYFGDSEFGRNVFKEVVDLNSYTEWQWRNDILISIHVSNLSFEQISILSKESNRHYKILIKETIAIIERRMAIQ